MDIVRCDRAMLSTALAHSGGVTSELCVAVRWRLTVDIAYSTVLSAFQKVYLGKFVTTYIRTYLLGNSDFFCFFKRKPRVGKFYVEDIPDCFRKQGKLGSKYKFLNLPLMSSLFKLTRVFEFRSDLLFIQRGQRLFVKLTGPRSAEILLPQRFYFL